MKRLIVVALLIAILGSNLFAQAKPGGIARQLAMGGSNAGLGIVLNPFIMDDPAQMFQNPAYQAMYRDYGFTNISGGGLTGLTTNSNGYGSQNAAIAFGLNDTWAAGAILSYDPSAVNLVSGLIAPIVQSGTGRTPQAIPPVANVWEAVTSYRLSSMDLGFGVMYGWSNVDAKASNANPAASASTEASANMWGFRGGVNADLGSGSSFNGSVALRLDHAADKKSSSPIVNQNTGEYSASGSELQVNVRARFNVSSKFGFVPYATLVSASADPKEDVRPNGILTLPTSLKLSALAYAVGAGGEFKTSTFYFAGGISWQSVRVKSEITPQNVPTITNTATYSAIPVINLGGEWSFTDWLVGRAGVYRSIGNVNLKSESPASTTETNSSVPNSSVVVGGIGPANWDGMVTMGLGFKFGGWALDATVSDEALRRGLGLIGSNDNINTFGYLTASFNFAD
ncbi:MAG: hypothetical protein HY033_13805 [Ignavibacteriae bacterium]|nr:hypothetical protein [Ignavibacteria bacterium]MBI3365964.1 hypothetical protein [Ignavibacteriota bacterium]